MWWLCLLLLPARLSANSTVECKNIETPEEFYRNCSATKDCLKMLKNGLDQFWNVSLSAEEADYLNENYTDAAEYANLPDYVIKNSQNWPKNVDSLFTGSCPYLSYAVRDDLLSFGWRGCSFAEGQHCLFMLRPNETNRRFEFSAECDVGNQAVELCKEVDEKTGYYCHHTIWNGVYKGTDCCSSNGYNVFQSVLFRGFFNSTPEVDSILRASIPHLAKMGRGHVKIDAVWRWPVLGVGLLIYAGIIGLVHFVYWKIQIRHVVIWRKKDDKYCIETAKGFDSVKVLIDWYLINVGVVNSSRVILKTPVPHQFWVFKHSDLNFEGGDQISDFGHTLEYKVTDGDELWQGVKKPDAFIKTRVFVNEVEIRATATELVTCLDDSVSGEIALALESKKKEEFFGNLFKKGGESVEDELPTMSLMIQHIRAVSLPLVAYI